MVMDNGLDFDITIPEFYIDNGMIKKSHSENDSNNGVKEFKWKTGTNLQNPVFMEFISIDTNKEEQIIKFCNKYGLIDAKRAYSREPIPEKYIFYYSVSTIESESVEEFINEVNKMRMTIELHEAVMQIITDEEYFYTTPEFYNKVIQTIQQMTQFESDENLSDIALAYKNFSYDEIIKNFSYIKHIAFEIVLLQINKCIMGIFPQINSDGWNTGFIGSWKAPTLLSSLYYELFLKISQNKKIRKCRNSTCSKYFEIIGNDLRKIYCDSDCASLEAKRKERARKKLSS